MRLWDLRKRENTNVLTPHLVDKVARPRFGKWIGAVDFTEDWLVRNNKKFFKNYIYYIKYFNLHICAKQKFIV